MQRLNQIYTQQRQHVAAKRPSDMAYHFPVTIHFTGKKRLDLIEP